MLKPLCALPQKHDFTLFLLSVEIKPKGKHKECRNNISGMTGADFSLWMTILHSELWNRKEQSALRPEELEFSQRPVSSSVVFVMYQFTVPIWLQSAGGSNTCLIILSLMLGLG